MLRMPTQQYEKLYAEILNKLNPEKVYKDLLAFGKGRDVAMLCFEKDPKNCHRLLAANWLQTNLNIIINEF